MNISSITPLIVAILSGGGLFALLKWRPEATSASVKASDSVIGMLQVQLNRLDTKNIELTERVTRLETQLEEERNNRITAERAEATAVAKLNAEHELRIRAERMLASISGGRRHAIPEATPITEPEEK